MQSHPPSNMVFPDHFNNDQKFLSGIYRKMLSAARLSAKMSKWFAVGNAAFVGIIFTNLDTVKNVVGVDALRWGLGLLVLTLACGAATFALNQSVVAMMKSLDGLNRIVNAAAKTEFEMTQEAMNDQFISPFWGPLLFMVKPKEDATPDPLHTEKHGVNLVCWIVLLGGIQIILGVLGMGVLVLNIH